MTILIVSGPGGVGKGTVVAQLMALDPLLWLSRSWTTRPRRPGEADDAYVFVDEDAFAAKVDAGGFLEWTTFAGNGRRYGTPVPDPPPGRDVVLEIELDGAGQVKRRFPDAVLVLIVAPPGAREARMRQRGDDEEDIRRRVRLGEEEVARGRGVSDHVVVNDDVVGAAREVEGILQHYRGAARARPER